MDRMRDKALKRDPTQCTEQEQLSRLGHGWSTIALFSNAVKMSNSFT